MAVSRTLVLIYLSVFAVCFATGFGFGGSWSVHKYLRVPHRLEIGDIVERGSDWKFGEQDVGKLGVVISELCPEKWIAVRWLDNSENEYRHGNNSKYDIKKVTRSLHFNTAKELDQAKKDWGNLGRSVSPKTVPYLVELRMSGSGKEVCGGSIVNSRWIVTAASCVARRNGSVKAVVAYTGLSEGYDVQEVIVHPGWNSSGRDFGFGNDIALVKVRNIFRKTKLALPLLYNTDSSVLGPATITSWQRNVTTSHADLRKTNKNHNTQRLFQGTVPVISNTECKKAYPGLYNEATMLCGGYLENTITSCKASAGGALVQDGKLVGVVSRGASCPKNGLPSVYTRVSAYGDWLRQQMMSNTI